MNLAIRARDVIRGILPALGDEMDSLVQRINFVWQKEHKTNGTHADITADSVQTRAENSDGEPSFQGTPVKALFQTASQATYSLAITNNTADPDHYGLSAAIADNGLMFVSTGLDGELSLLGYPSDFGNADFDGTWEFENPVTVQHLQLKEQSTPPPPGSGNMVKIYAEDDGFGKTRLMAQFPSGAPVQIAIEP